MNVVHYFFYDVQYTMIPNFCVVLVFSFALFFVYSVQHTMIPNLCFELVYECIALVFICDVLMNVEVLRGMGM